MGFTITIDPVAKTITWFIFDNHGLSQGSGTGTSMVNAAQNAIAALKVFVQSQATSMTSLVGSVA